MKQTNFFSSNAEEIKYYTKQLLKNTGHECSVAAIKKYVEKESSKEANDNGKKYSEGMFAGSFNSLLAEDSNFISTRRGFYFYKLSNKDFKDSNIVYNKIFDILTKTREELYSACNINLLDLDANKVNDSIEFAKKIIAYIDKIVIDENQNNED